MTGRTGLFVVRSAEVEYLTERGSAFPRNVHIPITRLVKAMDTKRRNVTNNVVQVCYSLQFCKWLVIKYLFLLQKNRSGVTGRTGLYVVRNVEVEYLTGRGYATNPNVPILTTKSVMEMIMKKRSVTSSVVQVCVVNHIIFIV